MKKEQTRKSILKNLSRNGEKGFSWRSSYSKGRTCKFREEKEDILKIVQYFSKR